MPLKSTIYSWRAVWALFLLTGCAITNTPGFHSGYKKLPPNEQQKIQFVAAGQAIPSRQAGAVSAVTAQSLLNALPDQDTTLVYIWAPHCHSRVCISLQSVQSVCTRKGYHLYVVAEHDDMEQIALQPKLENAILAINHKYYKSDYCPRYTRLFTTELLQGKHLPDAAKYARYYLFKGKSFVRAMQTVGSDAL